MPFRAPARVAALVAATALVLTACGSDDDSDDEARSGGGASSSGAFPVTVETAFGEVTIDEEPTVVVALGWSDAETALALGVQPVAASDWLAVGGDDGLGDWVQESYAEAPELIDTLEPSIETIAALEPDLILDTRSDATQERYDSLSQIAPTIGQPEGVGPYQTTWQQQLELVGQALGKADEAEQLQADLEQRIADAAAEHPEFSGVEVAVAAYTSEGFGAYVRGDGRVDFMEALGFENSPAVQAEAGDNFFIPVSEEQVSILDSELTVVFPIYVEVSEITSNPLWGTLTSVQEGRAIILEDTNLANAFSAASVAGITYALDNAVPLFGEALAG